MEYKIIVDSGCDITPQLRERLGAVTVPLTIKLGKKEFVDDDSLNFKQFLSEMKACPEKASSSCPSPSLYQEAIEGAKKSFLVTLSSQLSGSHSSALMGKAFAEENGKADTYVFDSKSASAGELLVAVKIRELIQKELSKDQIIQTVNSFIDNMKTYFVLERYDNLLKNGRLNRITGKIISVLNIKLIMGSDGNGNIALFSKPRGVVQMIDKILNYIRESGRKTDEENIVIAHCNNNGLAGQLSDAVKRHFNFKEIFVVPTRGLVSMYADDKGIVLAF